MNGDVFCTVGAIASINPAIGETVRVFDARTALRAAARRKEALHATPLLSPAKYVGELLKR